MKEIKNLDNLKTESNEYVFRIETSASNVYIITQLNDKFYNYFNRILDNTTVHEVMVRDPRKLGFDLDYYFESIHPWDMVEIIISESIIILQEYYNFSADPKDFLIFESNGMVVKDKKNVKKYSYHIVLKSCHFPSLNDTFFIYSQIANKYPDIGKYLDNIYSMNQNLRVLHSSKIKDKKRVKKFVRKYKLGNLWIKQNIDPRRLFQFSLISDVSLCMRVFNTKIEVDNYVQEEKIEYQNDFDDFYEVGYLLNGYFEPHIFKQGKIIQYEYNSIMCLESIYPYYCLICSRDHENENPYIVMYHRDGRCDCNFKCRRYDDDAKVYGWEPKSFCIGSVYVKYDIQDCFIVQRDVIKNEINPHYINQNLNNQQNQQNLNNQQNQQNLNNQQNQQNLNNQQNQQDYYQNQTQLTLNDQFNNCKNIMLNRRIQYNK